jgi:hypothetical protein
MSTTKRPNLFIIGAMKSGTTSLHSYLNTHPSIYMCEPKEPSYFVHPSQLNWPAMKELGLWNHEDRYLKLFEPADGATIWGESSTLYAKLPHITEIPERIAAFNPEAHFIYVMRDPVERTISHYWHEMRQGNENKSLMRAIQENSLYCDVSHYAYQLQPYLQRFGADRVLTFTAEEMVRDSSTIVRTIFEWLGVDASFVPPNLAEKVHVTPKRFFQKSKLFRLRYQWPWSAIADLLPRGIRQQGLNLAVKKVNQQEHGQDREAAIDFLRPIQQKQTQELSTLLGRDFPEWKTLWGTEPSP